MMSTDPKPLRITRLDVRQFKRLRAVSITPDGALVPIKGRNAQGKSSLIDAIHAGLAGKGALPPDPVRHGSRDAEITIDLGEFKVRRTMTEEGKTALVVTSASGAPITGPQTFLDSLIGKGLAFDPIEFARLEPRAQAEQLRKLAGLDFADLEGQRAAAYTKRTGVNARLTAAKAKLKDLPAPVAGLPDRPVSAAEISDRATKAMETKRENDSARSSLTHLKSERDSLKRRIDVLRSELAEAEEQFADLGTRITAKEPVVAALVDPDLVAIRAEMNNVEATNEKIRARDAYQTMAREVDQLAGEADSLTEQITGIDDAKAARIRDAAMPIEGLGFDEGGVTYGGVPFAQASSAEKLRVSMAIALAQNKALKVCLIRNGNDLDSDGLRTVAEMAEAAGAQVWIERVTDGDDEDGIVIEDGMVKATPAMQPA